MRVGLQVFICIYLKPNPHFCGTNIHMLDFQSLVGLDSLHLVSCLTLFLALTISWLCDIALYQKMWNDLSHNGAVISSMCCCKWCDLLSVLFWCIKVIITLFFYCFFTWCLAAVCQRVKADYTVNPDFIKIPEALCDIYIQNTWCTLSFIAKSVWIFYLGCPNF